MVGWWRIVKRRDTHWCSFMGRGYSSTKGFNDFGFIYLGWWLGAWFKIETTRSTESFQSIWRICILDMLRVHRTKTFIHCSFPRVNLESNQHQPSPQLFGYDNLVGQYSRIREANSFLRFIDAHCKMEYCSRIIYINQECRFPHKKKKEKKEKECRFWAMALYKEIVFLTFCSGSWWKEQELFVIDCEACFSQGWVTLSFCSSFYNKKCSIYNNCSFAILSTI